MNDREKIRALQKQVDALLVENAILKRDAALLENAALKEQLEQAGPIPEAVP